MLIHTSTVRRRSLTYAVQRRRFSVGESPTRQLSFRPVAIGAAEEVTNPLKYFGVEGRLG